MSEARVGRLVVQLVCGVLLLVAAVYFFAKRRVTEGLLVLILLEVWSVRLDLEKLR